MTDRTPQAVQACHELIAWLIPQLDKFPRLRRFTLGERLEQALLDVLELLLEAAYTRAKQPALLRSRAYRHGRTEPEARFVRVVQRAASSRSMHPPLPGGA
jgi:hypothetical protein